MRFCCTKRQWLSAALVASMVTTSLSALFINPVPGHAAISADPSEEIVFITANDTVSILDIAGEPKIGWTSEIPMMVTNYPEQVGGWKDLDLGDVNDDGDLEIIAIGTDASGNTKIAVFDPVVASGQVNPDQKVNGIPWDVLYAATYSGEAELIASDDFDAAIPGDEILVGYHTGNSTFKIRILKASRLSANGKPSGREWTDHIEQGVDFEHPWTHVSSGQIDDVRSAEVVLVDDESTETAMDVYSVDGGFKRIDGKHSDGDRWSGAAVGRIINQTGTKLDVAGIRSASKPDKASILVYTMDGDNELSSDGDWQWAFAPQPEFVFLADISGNGDEEVFFLRKHPSEKGPRLIMRDDWGDDKKNHPDIELALDEDDGYRVGAGGDVDGDGRDEIVIARHNNIRVYRDPHHSVESSTISNYAEDTNKKALKVGDLDKNGFVEGPQFGSDKTKVDAFASIGTKTDAYTVQITNISTAESIPFAVQQNLPPWVTVNPMFGSTPATLAITFDAADLSMAAYSAQLVVDSSAQVTNKPFNIELALTVGASALTPSPAGANVIYYPCTKVEDLSERSLTLNIDGTAGLNFRAALVEVPPFEVTQAGAVGAAVNGMVNDAGDIILSYGEGKAASFSIADTKRLTAAGGTIDWPEDIEWITNASSITSTVPTTLTVTVSPTLGHGTGILPFEIRYAVLVLAADTRAGLPPENVQIVPITVLCAQDQLHLPNVGRR